ncbi:MULTISPECIES: glycosyltransferase family 4 protein [unclassified Ornithinimicrobium]|uniref:glycosyltransferase family 4 protein n=1 Tax=unclassified Ornithinimicrobium TaxID=2615080 RepID=UPI003851F3AE
MAPREDVEADGEKSPHPSIVRLTELTEQKNYDEALTLAEQELALLERAEGPDPALLRQIQMSASKAGATSLHLRALRRRLDLFPEDPSLRRQLRTQEGRWRETAAGWLPTIDPAALGALSTPRAPDRHPSGKVLHLLKIGMPQRQSGYSMRSMYTLTGEVRAGLDPVAVTALDFPRNVGVADAPAVDEVRGVRYRHLLRDRIPSHEPWDAYLDAYATALAPVVAEEGPDLIHVHSGNRGYEAALVALAVGRALDLPVVYEVRGFFESLWTSDTSWAERSEVYDRRHATETWCMQQADAVVTLSESMKDDIVGRGVADDHVHVVPNGVDPTVFVPRERDEALTERLGLRDRFVFGYVSNLDHYREGQELLVDAAVELRRRGVRATALVVGDGNRRAELEEHARALEAGDTVLFTGRIPHDLVGDYYAQLDVFVVPRIDERAARLVTPLKPYEAMALGVPLVVSDLPALQEITGDGERGETFLTGDARSLADVLQRLHEDPARRAELAARAREWAVTERDWARNGDRYRTIYDSVLSASS